ncbi:hypothetical protein LB521_22950 [Mesorhizobium sp. BR-1-1-8]|nr:hypothetical protein [Mesorhizobium sp. BR-1-1-8]
MARKETGSERSGKAPTHGDSDAAHWTRIGAAWAHRDGEGFNLSLAAMPLSGRLVVRVSKEGGQ